MPELQAQAERMREIRTSVRLQISLGDSTSLDQLVLWYGSIYSFSGLVVVPVG